MVMIPSPVVHHGRLSFVLLFKTDTKRVNIALESKCQSTLSIKNSNAINALEMFIYDNFRHWAEGRRLKLLGYCSSSQFLYAYCVDAFCGYSLVVAVFTIKYEMIGSVSLLLLCDE
jgi:hypothetical protein